MAKYLCKYCGIEFDPSMSMCPACGHKNEKIIIPEKKIPETRIPIEKKVETRKETGKKPVEPVPEKIKVEKKKEYGPIDKKEEDYRKELERLEKSMFGEKEKSVEKPVKEKIGEKKEDKKEIKKETSAPSKKGVPGFVKLLFHSKAAYLVWFFLGFSGFSFFSGFTYSIADWYLKSARLLFGNDIQAEAELRNVHHLINDLNPVKTYNILNGDVLLFVPVIAAILPILLWLIKRKSKSVENPGNGNVFAGFIITLVLASLVLIGMRIISYSNLLFKILLAVIFCAPILDLGVFIGIFKQRGFVLKETIVVLLYNIGIPLLFTFLSGILDFIAKYIFK